MLVRIAIHLLEAIFVIGVLGSAAVVALTTMEDIKMFFDDRESGQGEHDSETISNTISR